MKIYKVDDLLATKYQGAGYALAATTQNELVDIVYLRDLIEEPEDGFSRQDLLGAIESPMLAKTVRELQALGDVHIGMLSCWQFVPL